MPKRCAAEQTGPYFTANNDFVDPVNQLRFTRYDTVAPVTIGFPRQLYSPADVVSPQWDNDYGFRPRCRKRRSADGGRCAGPSGIRAGGLTRRRYRRFSL